MDHYQRRIRWLAAGFTVLCVGIMARVSALEIGGWAELRQDSARPAVRRHAIPAGRGRILAHDGTVLVADEPLVLLALQYRYLQTEPDPHWLRAAARSRLTARERRLPDRVAAEEERLRGERAEMHRRLAELCGLSPDEWQSRCRRIEDRVQAIADGVNRRHQVEEAATGQSQSNATLNDESWFAAAGRKILAALFEANRDPPSEITVEEELQDHTVAARLSLDVVAEVEGHAEHYPGVTVVRGSRRVYYSGSLAAHVLGYARIPPGAAIAAGQSGVERQYDALLRGHDGMACDRLDRHGHVAQTTIERPPVAGRDLVLTIDARLQKSAEALLDSALARRIGHGAAPELAMSGGAIVALDVQTGAILAAASGPRFPAGDFADGNQDAIERSLGDPGHPLFDRTIQMAIPPGSVFKTVAALALLDDPHFDPQRPFDCQGYLVSPDSRRCMIYRRFGVGHGPVTLVDALAESCNVYFFHEADRIGLAPLVDWAGRFGFGQTTGIDLPGESHGHLEAPSAVSLGRGKPPADRGDAESLIVGQGTLTVTPLQVVRMMAAVANGGKLVTPHVVERLALASEAAAVEAADSPDLELSRPQSIPGLDERKLRLVREGLQRVVTDPKGTGHATVFLDGVAIAGKTGTAELGDGSPDHAWFAGYAPADSPRVAFVVVLEHGGEAATSAGPVAKKLVEQLKAAGRL